LSVAVFSILINSFFVYCNAIYVTIQDNFTIFIAYRLFLSLDILLASDK